MWPTPIAVTGRFGDRGCLRIGRNRRPRRFALELCENEACLLPHDRNELIVDRLELIQPRAGNIVFRRHIQSIKLAYKLLDFSVERLKLAVVHSGRSLVGLLRLGPPLRFRYRKKPLLEALLTFAIESAQSLCRLIDLNAKGTRVTLIRRIPRMRENRDKNSYGSR